MKGRSNSTRPSDSIVRNEPKAAKLKLTVQYATSTLEPLPLRPWFRKWIKAALMHDAEIALRIVDEAEGRRLNRDFRDKDYATNVLTFVYSDEYSNRHSVVQPGVQPNGHPLAGDIVLCAPVVENEARQQQKNLVAHYAHLTVHGVLHLQGYEHEKDADAEEMEQLETGILGRLGYGDPYKGHQQAAEEN